jgi:hypothetical protein
MPNARWVFETINQYQKAGFDDEKNCVVLEVATSAGDWRLRRLYKTLEGFEENVLQDIEHIDEMFSIRTQLWEYDDYENK